MYTAICRVNTFLHTVWAMGHETSLLTIYKRIRGKHCCYKILTGMRVTLRLILDMTDVFYGTHDFGILYSSNIVQMILSPNVRS